MYFGDCETPKELREAVSKLMETVTKQHMECTGPGPHFVVLKGPLQEETLRQAFAEALSVIRNLRKGHPDLPPLPDPACSGLEDLARICGWCEEADLEGREQQPESGGGKRRISLGEANLKAREILAAMSEPELRALTDRKLAELIPCSPSLGNKLPAWKAVKEHLGKRRNQRPKKPRTVSLTKPMESVLGTGEKDEVLDQLITEQEDDQQQEERGARLFLTHKKKPETGRS